MHSYLGHLKQTNKLVKNDDLKHRIITELLFNQKKKIEGRKKVKQIDDSKKGKTHNNSVNIDRKSTHKHLQNNNNTQSNVSYASEIVQFENQKIKKEVNGRIKNSSQTNNTCNQIQQAHHHDQSDYHFQTETVSKVSCVQIIQKICKQLNIQFNENYLELETQLLEKVIDLQQKTRQQQMLNFYQKQKLKKQKQQCMLLEQNLNTQNQQMQDIKQKMTEILADDNGNYKLMMKSEDKKQNVGQMVECIRQQIE